MPFYEFTLRAEVRRKIVQQGPDYDEALRLAKARFDLTTPPPEVEVEQFLVLEDDEVVALPPDGTDKEAE